MATTIRTEQLTPCPLCGENHGIRITRIENECGDVTEKWAVHCVTLGMRQITVRIADATEAELSA